MSEKYSYTFNISYFSEVSAKITVRVSNSRVQMSATHPMDGVTINDWFHFSDSYYPEDPLYVEGVDIHDVLIDLGEKLYPGASGLLEMNDDIDGTRQRFFTDLYLAFCYGEWYPARKEYPSDWEHPVGARLLQR